MGASFDTPAENKAFVDAQSFNFRLLSDVTKEVGSAYEALRPAEDPYAQWAARVAYLIDPEGTIREHYAVTDVAGFADQVLTDLDRLRAS